MEDLVVAQEDITVLMDRHLMVELEPQDRELMAEVQLEI
jgi:hypothetical protein